MATNRKRGRPLTDESTLLHPRKVWIRPTVLHGEILDIPEPSKAALKRWKHMVDACMVAILAQPSRANNTAPKNKVAFRFPDGWKKPEKFLTGVIVSRYDGGVVREFNAEQLLLWLYVRKLCLYCARDLYKMRSTVMHGLNTLEKEIDTMLEEDYNDPIEGTQGEEE